MKGLRGELPKVRFHRLPAKIQPRFYSQIYKNKDYFFVSIIPINESIILSENNQD